ncbi:MAG: hypothetical protein AB1498_09790 [bacterium]
MVDKIAKKDLGILLKESWDFFSKRWVVLFQITLFVWIPVLMAFPLAGFLWTSYYSLQKNNPELLFSFKVILAGGILFFTLIGIFTAALLMDKLIKVTIIDGLWKKPEEKYYLDFFKLIKDVWPKMGEFCKTQVLAWLVIFPGPLLLFAFGVFFLGTKMTLEEAMTLSLPLLTPGVLFYIWFSFVPYEVILRGKKGKDALSSSKGIVRYDLAKFAGNMLVIIGILLFINMGLSGFLKLVFSFFNSTALLNLGELIATIVSNIFGLWGTVFHFSLYRDLRDRYPGAKAGILEPLP